MNREILAQESEATCFHSLLSINQHGVTPQAAEEGWSYIKSWENDPGTYLNYDLKKLFPDELIISVTRFKFLQTKHDFFVMDDICDASVMYAFLCFHFSEYVHKLDQNAELQVSELQCTVRWMTSCATYHTPDTLARLKQNRSQVCVIPSRNCCLTYVRDCIFLLPKMEVFSFWNNRESQRMNEHFLPLLIVLDVRKSALSHHCRVTSLCSTSTPYLLYFKNLDFFCKNKK